MVNLRIKHCNNKYINLEKQSILQVEKQFRQSLSSSPNPYIKEQYLEVAKTDDTLSVPGDNPEMTNATFMVYDELDTVL